MRQEDSKKIENGLKRLETLKEMRGGTLLPFHKKCANDVKLLEAFNAQYEVCNGEANTLLERKYRELVLMAMGCCKGVSVTVDTHARLALKYGATMEEVSEILRLVFFYCGASELIPAVEIFEELKGSEGL